MLNKLKITGTLFATILVLAACGSSSETESSSSDEGAAETSAPAEVKIGVVGDVEREVWEDVAARLEADNIDLQIEVFTDYVQPNVALADGSLDINAFQHMAYLSDFIQSEEAEVEPIGYTYISPMAAYSDSIESLDNLPEGASVAIPNDPTNGGRALLLLQQAGVITLDEAAGITPTANDITANPKNIKIEELEAAQVPRAIADADVVVANTNFAVDAGLDPYKDGIFVDTEDLSKVGSQYKNVAAVRSEDKDSEVLQRVIAEYQTEETEAKIAEVTNGADQKAWTENDDIKADFAKVQTKAAE